MSIVSNIRSYFFKNHLEKKLSKIKLNRSSIEFDVAGSIGILFDATDAINRTKVMDYAQNLIKNGKKVTLFGFVKGKQKDLSFPFKFFTFNEVNWKMIPESTDVNQFINKKFDILISLYLGKNNPIEYISALSNANFRVGPFSENTNSFDLIIDTQIDTDLEHLIKQVNFFLNKINSPVYGEAV